MLSTAAPRVYLSEPSKHRILQTQNEHIQHDETNDQLTDNHKTYKSSGLETPQITLLAHLNAQQTSDRI